MGHYVVQMVEAPCLLPQGDKTSTPGTTVSCDLAEVWCRQTHAKDTAKLTRKTEQQKSTNGNVQVKPAKQIPSGI
jgi:hypothetical protein